MRLRADQLGSTLLEGALVIPLYVGFVLAVVNMAVLLNNYIAVNSAARDAAAAVGATGSALAGEQAGWETLKNIGFMGQGDVRAVQPRRGDPLVHVEATYETKLVAPGFAALLGGNVRDSTVTTKSTTSTVLEYQHRTKDPWESRKGRCDLKGLAREMCSQCAETLGLTFPQRRDN